MAHLPYQVMNLRPASELPSGPEWCYQPKFNGYRMIGHVALKGANLITRWDNDFTDRYPDVAAELELAAGGKEIVVDGELVGLNESGQEDFYELQRLPSRAVYYIFDLLKYDDQELIQLPLEERQTRLNSLVEFQPHVQLAPTFYDKGLLIDAARELGFEGIVAKRLSSRYRPGRRSDDWQKFKFAKQRGFYRS